MPQEEQGYIYYIDVWRKNHLKNVRFLKAAASYSIMSTFGVSFVVFLAIWSSVSMGAICQNDIPACLIRILRARPFQVLPLLALLCARRRAAQNTMRSSSLNMQMLRASSPNQ